MNVTGRRKLPVTQKTANNFLSQRLCGLPNGDFIALPNHSTLDNTNVGID
jgi:hypothetical protein